MIIYNFIYLFIIKNKNNELFLSKNYNNNVKRNVTLFLLNYWSFK